jgi:hypothetical protein
MILLLFISTNANAYCSEPSAPDVPGTYSKPSPPFCMSGYNITREHTCDSWQINSYIGEVNDYIRKLNDFAQEAANYANEASEYARCEANDIKSQIN